jgi:lipoate-protein ligase A
VEYRVDYDFENGEPVERSAAVNMALDEHILDRAAEEEVAYLRVYSFEEPAFVPSRRTSAEDIAPAVENGYDFSRRDTNGSTIPCLDSGVAYSVAYPTEDFPDRVFEERVAPALVEALTSADVPEDELDVCLKHDAVRYGDRETPEGIASGRTIAGNSLWRNGGSVLSHGVVAVEPWDTEFLSENMALRSGEEDFIEDLPSVDALGGYGREDFSRELVRAFTDGEYKAVDLGADDVEDLLGEKYENLDWVLDESHESGRGHCFVEEEVGRFY